MTILIELVYYGHEHNIVRRGNFRVDKRKFNEDQDRAAAEVAFRWVKQIRREEYISKIIKVKYNAIDITELVQDLYHINL